MWVATQDLPRPAARPFYTRLNQILDARDFDGHVEGLCERFYAHDGRPGLPPGRDFRLRRPRASRRQHGRALARIDRKRKKKGSNDDWTHPHDPDAKITKMKAGRPRLAHKAEHAVDLETSAIVGVTVIEPTNR